MCSIDSFCLHEILVIISSWFSAHSLKSAWFRFWSEKGTELHKAFSAASASLPTLKKELAPASKWGEAGGCKDVWKMQFLQFLSFSSVNLRQFISPIYIGQVCADALKYLYKNKKEKASQKQRRKRNLAHSMLNLDLYIWTHEDMCFQQICKHYVGKQWRSPIFR